MLFHIGYHKTATTFLQKELFESMPMFHRVPQREIFWNLIFPHTLEFDVAKASEFVRGYQKIAEHEGAVPVFSNERLSGGHHTGGHDSVDLCERIALVAPEARILLFVREQKSLILSLYAQYVKAMGCVSLQEYCQSSYTNHNKELFNPITLEFDRLVACYLDRFQNVLVMPFELLKRDPDAVIARIVEFAGGSVAVLKGRDFGHTAARNTARSAVLQRVDRFLHPLRYHNIPHVGSTYYNPIGRYLAGGVSRMVGWLPTKWLDRRLSRKDRAFVEKFVANRYVESNSRLSKLIGMNLADLGYS